MRKRCEWVEGAADFYIAYHDDEWGVPLHHDSKLFEFLVLDAFQAGLSWAIILRKRDNFRKAFDRFDAKKIVTYSDEKIVSLLSDTGIIRNKQKILATIINAKGFLDIQKEFGSFDEYIWQFVGGKTMINEWKVMGEIPAKTKESEAMCKDLVKRGFSFVGPTICYAFMQAAGLVNDHTVDCYRYREINKMI